MELLPKLPEDHSDEELDNAIAEARAQILGEHTTKPELHLKPQSKNVYCAPATARMILLHHHFNKSQSVIAREMHALPKGATPVAQVKAIRVLTDNKLVAQLDKTTSFSEAKSEISQNRPFKLGGPAHARACGGFKVEKEGKNWLYIYDPFPANQGRIYYEAWEADQHINYMYVRPDSYL